MAMNNIIQRLSSFIQNKLSIPLIPISAIMLLCSTIKRPGISPMLITAKIIDQMGEKGAPIGVNIDGSPNLMNQMYFTIVDQIINAIKMDGKVEIAIAPGAIVSSGFANGVPVISNNVGAVSGSGIVR
jgi:hypothetical protein